MRSLTVIGTVDFSHLTKFRIRAEDQIAACRSKLRFACFAIANIKEHLAIVNWLPLVVHAGQDTEKVIGQNAGSVSEDTML